MSGYVRLVLAIIVLLSHVGVRINDLNPGVIAVVIFYIFAGSVVTYVWHDIIPDRKNKIFLFYKNRVLRIFPLYLYAMVLTLFFLMATSYGTPSYQILPLINNILIIPLNYYMFIDSTVIKNPDWNLVPPAWSLGTELQAYILLPIIFCFKWLGRLLVFISFIIYMMANFSYIETDYFGYRLLPGVFFIFFIGSHLRNCVEKKNSYFSLLIFYAAAIFYLGSVMEQNISVPYIEETLLGLIIGIPLAIGLMKLKHRLKYDQQAGALSYGVFLMHFLVIWWIDFMQIMPSIGIKYYLTVIFLTISIAGCGVLIVEKRH